MVCSPKCDPYIMRVLTGHMSKETLDEAGALHRRAGHSETAASQARKLLTNRNKVEGIILAGVYKWAAASFEDVVSRPLVPVAGAPLIFYALEWLREAGISKATICANSESRSLRMCLRDGSPVGMKLDYYEDLVLRGPAGCVRDAVVHSNAEVFVVCNGTSIPQVDLQHLMDAHYSSGATVTAVLRKDTPGNGNVGRDCLLPTGIYVLQRQVLDHISEAGYQDIKEGLIPHLHGCGVPVAAYVSDKPCLHVRDAGSYLAANGWILRQMAHQTDSLREYRKVGESLIHRSVPLRAGIDLIGPVLIGPGTAIEPGVTIVGPTAIGAQCTVDEDVVICRSVIWDRCTVGKGSMLDRCVVISDTEVVPKTRLCNAIHVSSG